MKLSIELSRKILVEGAAAAVEFCLDGLAGRLIVYGID